MQRVTKITDKHERRIHGDVAYVRPTQRSVDVPSRSQGRCFLRESVCVAGTTGQAGESRLRAQVGTTGSRIRLERNGTTASADRGDGSFFFLEPAFEAGDRN